MTGVSREDLGRCWRQDLVAPLLGLPQGNLVSGNGSWTSCVLRFSTKKWGKCHEHLAKSDDIRVITEQRRQNFNKYISKKSAKTWYQKMKKLKVFLHFLDFGSPGSSWLRCFVFQFFCFSFFIISFSFFLISDHFLEFFMISCVLQHFRPKNEGNEMKTWQKLMSYKQSQKNEDKMIQKCKKKKIQKWNLFVAFFSTSAHLAFLGSAFSLFFLSCLFHFFIMSDHFLRYLHGFFGCAAFSTKRWEKCDEHLAKSDDNFQPIPENARKKIIKVSKNV